MKLTNYVVTQARKGVAVAAAVAAIGVAGGAMADPINFIPSGTDFAIKFVDREVEITQVGQELFGIFNITTITNANGTQTFWNGNGVTDGTQLVGFFQGLTAVADQTGGTGLSFTGGTFSIFDVANGVYSPGTTPNTKNFLNQLCGGSAICLANPWLSGVFSPGINDSINGNATLQAALATTNVQAGFGFQSVTGGANAARFDTNGFTFTNFGPADLFLRSNFVLAGSQSCPTSQSDGWQVCSDDPITGRTIPEPATVAIMGLVLAALGVTARRRKAM